MKTGKHQLGTGGILAVTACLIALLWVGMLQAIDAQRAQVRARVEAVLAGQAAAAAAQIERQIISIDQALRQIAAAWLTDPRGFDIGAQRAQAVALNGLAQDVLLIDAAGVVQQSTLSEAIGRSVTGQSYFAAFATSGRTDTLFLGPATISPLLRQWHMNAARPIYRADRSLAGVIDTDYRISAITRVLSQPALGAGGLAMLIGLNDGKMRGAVGAPPGDPDLSLADTALFAELKQQPAGVWLGRSPVDAVPRIHAFHRLANRDLAVAVAMDEQEAYAPVQTLQGVALLAALGGTVLLLLLAWLLAGRIRLAARSAARERQNQEDLAVATAQAEAYKAADAARGEHLDAVLANTIEGICIIDSRMCVAHWSSRYPELAGIPPERMRIGLPLEEMLRAQLAHGETDPADDPEAEIARRMARLRSGTYTTTRRQRQNGRVVEIQRRMLPDGGFVTFYIDITEKVRSEETLSELRALLGAARGASAWFSAAVLRDLQSVLAILGSAARAGTDNASLVQRADLTLRTVNADIDEIASISAGAMNIHRRLFSLPALIDDVVTSCGRSLVGTEIVLLAPVSGALPPDLYTDPDRLRQLLTSLIELACFGSSGRTVTLEVQPPLPGFDGLALMIRASRHPLDPAQLSPFLQGLQAALSAPAPGIPALNLRTVICGEVAARLDASIACEAWRSPDGEKGLSLSLRLPAQVLPAGGSGQAIPAIGDLEAVRELPWPRLPRTRVLLADDIPAAQVVTATLLRRAGHLVDIAANGAEAIEAVQSRPYDLVFMDMMMPGMGGTAATAAIRALPEPARSVPVVALTADMVAAGDGDAKQAGFDGVLVKPVTLNALLQALGAYVWYRFPKPEERPGTARAAGDTPPPPPVLAADRLLELRTNLPPETFVQLIEECLVDLDAKMPALRRAISSGALGAVTAHAHAMVGMAAGYGMAALEASLRSALAAARAGDRAALGQAMITQIEADLATTTRALREMMQDVLA
ncbi:MAG: PAS-domain containing protein [Proteobacteria bacterium]|nr:PAS-domain containing protein [Pseudomonadota bacterium]